MQDLPRLAEMLREIEEQMVSCMKCGMCQAACPLYAQTGREADVARGKIALLEDLSREILNDPVGVQKRLDRCLLCGSCQAACPSGVKVMQILIKAKLIINTYLGLPFWQRLLFRGMLSRPRIFDALSRMAAKFQAPFVKASNPQLGSSCSRIQTSFLKDRNFPSLAKTPLHSSSQSLDIPRGSSNLKVAMFTGCLVDKLFPHVGDKVLDLLGRESVGIFAPMDIVCCGIPSLAGGDRKSFTRLVKRNLQIFEQGEFDYLITSCATCTSTIKEIWPLMADMFTPEENARINELAEKTLDVNQFLIDKLGISSLPGKGGEQKKVTYHDPCHLRKSLGVVRQPRELLAKNPDLELQEMAEPERCCGMGGSFNLKHYDLSRKIGEKKRDNILNTQADIVSTSCPACMVQLIDLLSESGRDISVKHPVELYVDDTRY